MREIGLIGTITSDTILYDDGRSFRNLGGILYQAAVLCGLGLETALFTNCGEALRPEVEAVTRNWATLRRDGLAFVPGPGNQVSLRYSERLKEREEVLRSVVPPLDPSAVFAAATAARLAGGGSLLAAVEDGVALASAAAGVAGIRETYDLAVRARSRRGNTGPGRG